MNKLVAQKTTIYGILTALLTISVGQGMALADSPGQHPAYLHARSDLRKADILLNAPDERNVVGDLRTTDYEIDVAIREIDRAAILDRKDIDDHPQVDTSLNHTGRLHEILRLLEAARRDISETENNRYARGWRSRAEYHVNRAIYFSRKAINDDARDDRRQDH